MSRRSLCLGLALGLVLSGLALGQAPPASNQDPKALAQSRLKIAQKVYEAIEEANKDAPAGGAAGPDVERPFLEKAERISVWSQRWMEAQVEASSDRAGRIAAHEGHLERQRKWEKYFAEAATAGVGPRLAADILTFHRLEAEARLLKERATR